MKLPSHRRPSRSAAAPRQRGVSLLFSMMSLVVMGLAAVALVRAIDTGTLIMGNLSFKQDTLSAASAGSEQAMTWLQANYTTSVINADNEALGYYATDRPLLDPTGARTSAANKLQLVNWDGNCQGYTSATYSDCDVTAFRGADVNGNRVQWVITRLCTSPGAPSGANLCVRPATTSTSNATERGELLGMGRANQVTAGPYFRIIVRVEGARNTVSYTETLVHF